MFLFNTLVCLCSQIQKEIIDCILAYTQPALDPQVQTEDGKQTLSSFCYILLMELVSQ